MKYGIELRTFASHQFKNYCMSFCTVFVVCKLYSQVPFYVMPLNCYIIFGVPFSVCMQYSAALPTGKMLHIITHETDYQSQ